MKTNYHTHCHYCDGKGDPREYVLEAINKGFTSLGFSSHAPIKEDSEWTMRKANLDRYLENIDLLKEEFSNKINIYKGMEIDYYHDEDRFKLYRSCDLDYSIGAVHMLYVKDRNDYFSVDASPKDFEMVMSSVFGSIEEFVKCYYLNLRNLIKQGGFNILAHFDLIKKYNRENRFFSEDSPWYIKEIIETLDLLSTTNIIVEVNTGAIAGGVQDTPYPSKWILDECFKRDIKVCLNSDCHLPEKIDCFFDEALNLIRSSGYKELTTPFETIDLTISSK